MAMNIDPNIAKAQELLERLGSLDEVRRYYEAREMAVHDEVTRLTGAKAEGHAIGKAEGEAEGIIKGKLEAARQMLAKNLPEDLIIEITGLTPEQLAALKAAPAGEGN